jgi:acyl carrier protein
MDTRQRIKAFLSKHIKATDISDEANLFEQKLVNSLFAMQLVTFLEKEFELVIENEELNLENFKSVNAIVAFVERKLS